MKGKEQRWDIFVSYSNLKSPPPMGVLEETQRLNKKGKSYEKK